jgi:hypothetical protein
MSRRLSLALLGALFIVPTLARADIPMPVKPTYGQKSMLANRLNKIVRQEHGLPKKVRLYKPSDFDVKMHSYPIRITGGTTFLAGYKVPQKTYVSPPSGPSGCFRTVCVGPLCGTGQIVKATPVARQKLTNFTHGPVSPPPSAGR